MALGRPGAADDPARRHASCRRRRCCDRAATAAAASTSTGTRRSSAGSDVDDWPGAMREALQARGPAPDGRRRAGRDPLARRPGLLPDRGAARASGADGAGHVLDRLRGRRRARPATSSSSRTWSRREFGTDHQQLRIDRGRLVDALPQAIDGDERADGLARLRRLLAALEAVRRERKVVQSGQGADEVLGGYSWYPPLLGRRGQRAWTSTRRASSTATTPACARCWPTRPTTTSRWRSRAAWFERAGRDHRRSTARCAWTPR